MSTSRSSIRGPIPSAEPSTRPDALQELLTLKPHFAVEARQEYAKWFGPGELVEDVLEGLRKAGLDIPPTQVATP